MTKVIIITLMTILTACLLLTIIFTTDFSWLFLSRKLHCLLPSHCIMHIYNYVHLEDFLSILLSVDVSIVMSTSFNKHSQECFSDGGFVTHSRRYINSSCARRIYAVNSKTIYSAKNKKSLHVAASLSMLTAHWGYATTHPWTQTTTTPHT